MARRSATSTLAFCTQTLWKAARRAQQQVGTGRHLRVGAAPTEGLPGTQAPKEASSLPQTPSASGPTRWAHRPSARPMPERNGAHADKAGQAAPGRAVTSGPKIPHNSRSGTPVCLLRPALGRAREPQTHPLGTLVQEACSHSSSLPCPSSAQSSSRTPLVLRISQCVVGFRVAIACPPSRASSSSEKAPWRKWALRGHSWGESWNQVSVTYRDLSHWAPPWGWTHARLRTTGEGLGLTRSPPLGLGLLLT